MSSGCTPTRSSSTWPSTRDIDSDPVRRALAASLVAFAREIGATIVAEGIQTREELDTLRSLGVTHGQGYYLGPTKPGARAGADRPCRRGTLRRGLLTARGSDSTAPTPRPASATAAPAIASSR